MSIPNKTQWQEHKKNFGIPDGLSSVKMGDAFQAWIVSETALRNKRDYNGCLQEIEKLVVTMMTYAKALKAAKPESFGGKNPGEKQTHYTGANAKFKEIFGEVTKAKATYLNFAKPVLGVQDALRKAESAFKGLKNTSPKEAWQKFYSEQFRGIALPLKVLAGVNTDPGIKRGIIGFNSHANLLNDMLGKGSAPFNGSEAFGHASTALALLSGEVGRK
jgi:hypothetical protein